MRSKKVLLLILGMPLALILAVVAYVSVSFAWAKVHQISEDTANQTCQDFYKEVQSQITNIPGYAIDRSTKQCHPQKDEAGFTDYTLEVIFKVSRSNLGTPTEMRNTLNELADRLPQKGYPVIIQNMQNGEQAMCVSASRYIDDNGKDIPQGGPNGPHASYVTPGSTKGFTPCEDF